MKIFNKNTTTAPAVSKDETKVITFVGSENGMYVYHTIKLLQAAKHNIDILVIDNSVSGDLFNSVGGDEDVRMIGNFSMLRNRICNQEVFSKFDCVIVYLGKCADQEYINISSKVYFLCDYSLEAFDLLRATELPTDTEEDDVVNNITNLIFINKISEKVSEERFYKAKEGCFTDKEKSISVVSLSDVNSATYIEWLWGGDRKFSKLSSDYREAVSKVAADYFGEPVKKLMAVGKNI